MMKKEQNFNPAALGALVKGDVENFMVASTPGGIEAQEAQGQKDLIEKQQLPKEGLMNRPDILEGMKKLGFTILETGDDLFIDCVFPEGWKLKATDHSMHNELLNEKGRKRAGIFYKAAFYDRSANINIINNIGYVVDHIGFINGNYDRDEKGYVSEKTPFVGMVKDASENVLFITSEKLMKTTELEAMLKNLCLEFLADNYPDYENPFKYWD